ncbi:MAG: HD domain-containing protein [Desulfobacteraceae bacterium]|nr:HD domain-containing protein [Desulfobacteraceae bacterium]
MQKIAQIVLEGCSLKHVYRNGYRFIGAGRESVAEHVYSTGFIAFIMSELKPQVNAGRLLAMCMIHDLPEARMGDLDYLQKKYVSANESQAIEDATGKLPFGDNIKGLLTEFNKSETLEAKLAHDADQLALIADLKMLDAAGYQKPQTWIPHIKERLKTDLGLQIADALLACEPDSWWKELLY